MGKVATGLSISLDGFIAGPNDGSHSPLGDGGERLFAWYSGGETEYRLPGTELVFKVSPQSAELLREVENTMGACVTGRRTFDISGGWGGRPPLGVPTFVVTHTVPQDWVYAGSPFEFVTDGVESAVRQAKAVAGEKDVAVMAASIVQQCIGAGLLDEIVVNLILSSGSSNEGLPGPIATSFSSPPPFFIPHSPECVEGVFSEVGPIYRLWHYRRFRLLAHPPYR